MLAWTGGTLIDVMVAVCSSVARLTLTHVAVHNVLREGGREGGGGKEGEK